MKFINVDTILWRTLTLKKYLSKKRPSILLAAMPKSGSTFLSKSLQISTGFGDYYLAASYGNIEQELYLPSLIQSYDKATVTQQHLRANATNLRLLNTFEISCVVLFRNIFDVLVSMRDHLVKENLGNIPSLYPPDTFRAMNQSSQLDYLSAYAAPWLISFFASWQKAIQSNSLPILPITYEECVGDWPSQIARILDFYRIDYEADALRAVVDSLNNRKASETRRNVGIIGRGADAFSSAQKHAIIAMAASYPDVDFSLIGL